MVLIDASPEPPPIDRIPAAAMADFVVTRKRELAAKAHCLRHHPTPSKQRLRGELQASRLRVSFRRQVVIGRYIADFVCREAHLIVEVDGEAHAHRPHLDAHRDGFLQRAGYRVLRIPAALVTRNLPGAVELVRHVLRA